MNHGKALITGGAGFIGSHLAERLLAEGSEVVALDDLSTGSHRNVEHLKSDKRFRLVVADVAEEESVGDLVREAEVIYHLAAAVGVRLIVEQPLASMATNIRGTETLLEQANRWQRRHLLEPICREGRHPQARVRRTHPET